MKSLMDFSDELGKEIRQKRDAEKAAKQKTDEIKKEVVKEQKQHEENKRRGML